MGAHFTITEAAAQVAPNAGTLQRQLRDGMPDVLPPQQPAPPATAAPEQAPGDERRLTVSRFIIDGATLIPVEELTPELAPYLGADKSLRDLQAAAQAIADSYRRHGFFARAFIPAQTISDGFVHIQVVEGRFGSLRRHQPEAGTSRLKATQEQSEPARRADPDFVDAVVGGALVPGQPYSLDALERGLLLANDLPGVSVDGTLKAGHAQGTSDLELDIRDRPLLSASLGTSNGGTRATGRYVGAAAASLNGATGQGDQLSALGMKSQGLSYGLASFAVPLGPDGWRLGVSASAMTYRLINDDFRDLQAHGTATTQGIELSYPLTRSSMRNQKLRGFAEHATYDDDALGDALHRKTLRRFGLGLGGDWSDSWGGGGLTSYALSLSGGVLDLGGLADDDAQDKATAKTGGGFAKLAGDAHRDQRLAEGLFLRTRLSGQWSNQNLDSAEQFPLGGPQGVRAYPVNEGLGDRGALTNLELHRSFDDDWARGLDLFGFIDAGVTVQHAHPWSGWDNGTDIDNIYGLAGAGLGASYALAQDFGVSLMAAVPFGSNRGSASDGRTQDGGRRGPLFWFTLTKIF